jgi:hypothetical protein
MSSSLGSAFETVINRITAHSITSKASQNIAVRELNSRTPAKWAPQCSDRFKIKVVGLVAKAWTEVETFAEAFFNPTVKEWSFKLSTAAINFRNVKEVACVQPLYVTGK